MILMSLNLALPDPVLMHVCVLAPDFFLPLLAYRGPFRLDVFPPNDTGVITHRGTNP